MIQINAQMLLGLFAFIFGIGICIWGLIRTFKEFKKKQ
jgi:hypothetical protein